MTSWSVLLVAVLHVWVAADGARNDRVRDDRDGPSPVLPEPPPLACGPCAMALALHVLDVPTTNEELRGISGRSGTSSFAQLARFARRKGLHAEAFRLTPSQLESLERVAILQVLARHPSGGQWREHFVTWAGPGRTPHTGVIFDPVTTGGRGEVPMKILVGKWTGAALVISKTPVDTREFRSDPLEWPLYARSGGIGALLATTAWSVTARVRRRRGRKRAE